MVSKASLGCVLVLALGAVGCKSTDKTTTDGGVTQDSGTHDSGVVTNDGSTSGDAGGDFVFNPSTTAIDTAANYVSMNNAADLAFRTADCNCNFMNNGFDTAAACIAAIKPPDTLHDTCTTTAYGALDPATKAAASCFISLTNEQATCFTATSCDPSNSQCSNSSDGSTMPPSLNDAATTCQNLATDSNALAAFNTAISNCVVAGTVGTGTDTCGADVSPTTTTGAAVFMGTTVGAGDHRKPPIDCLQFFSCDYSQWGAVQAPDVTLSWRATTAGTYTIDTLGSNFDSVLYVLPAGIDACTSNATLACDDDDSAAHSSQSAVTVTLSEGQAIQIVVDGFDITTDENQFGSKAAGNYVVNINPFVADADGGVADAGVADDAGVMLCPPPATDGGVDAGVTSDMGTADAG